MRRLWCTSLALLALSTCCLGSGAAMAAEGREAASPTEVILAGGALALCSDLSPQACGEAPEVVRSPPMYRFDPPGSLRAGDPRLWAAPGAPTADTVAQWLQSVVKAAGAGEMTRTAAVELLERRPPGDGRDSPWMSFTDGERDGLLSAFEVPQIDNDGNRLRERADPRDSHDPGGLAVIEAFVASARVRAGGAVPRVLVVTASAFDPMEPVDFYESMFAALGAEGHWWPVDAAMAKARFPKRSCESLDDLRISELGVASRERVYPDLAARAAMFCESGSASLDGVHGVFFAGGDQWRLLRAFVDGQGSANPWLQALRAAHARGALVVGGTSAGAAVQSGAAMLTNGSVTAAIEGRVTREPPPDPGCGRAGRCASEHGEDALGLWMAGGLGLAHEAIVDTHFSERARELRLLVAMGQADVPWGYGADETSALRLREDGGIRTIDALGARGGWVFRKATDDTVLAWYLSPGVRLVIDNDTVRLDGLDGREPPRRPKVAIPHDATAPGALRDAAARLAWRCGRSLRMIAGQGTATIGCIHGETKRWVGDNGVAGIGPLQLSLSSVKTAEPKP